MLITFLATACDWQVPRSNEGLTETPSDTTVLLHKDSVLARVDSQPADNAKIQHLPLPPAQTVDVKNVYPNDLVTFAETLIGTPYVYASSDPKVGFDCSGFITYVFNRFGIAVPRSSVDFTDVGKTVSVEEAKRGDLILFTGTNPAERQVGHMGIIVSNTDSLRFIHSSSGKAMGVTVTPLNKYYQSRFVRVARIFPQNDIPG